MGRKKKETVPLPGTDAPPAAPAVSVVPVAAATVLTTVPENGRSNETPAFMAEIRTKGVEWAEECGLRPPFSVSGPDRIDYPRHGHGYVVTVQEKTGKCRLGSARFTSEGVRSYWSLDTLITG